MDKMNKRKQKNIKTRYTIQSIIPLILIVTLVPLIVRMKVLPISVESRIFTNGSESASDFFSYYKKVFFLSLTGLAIFTFTYKYINEHIRIKKTKIYYPIILFSILVILSTLFATYRNVALNGFWDRYEGMFVLLGYMATMFITINLIDNEKQIKTILMTLGLSSIIMSIIGITQVLGMDVFQTTIGKRLMLPAQYKSLADNLSFTFAKSIYGTLYNPNYVGLYMSTIFILSTTILLLIKDRRVKLFTGIVASLALINLLGSGSRAGMISIAFFIVIITIFFRDIILKRWKTVSIVFLALIGMIFIVNVVTNGNIVNRISSINSSIAKTEESNLKDIILEANKARILIDNYEIRMVNGNDGVTFMDEDDNLIYISQEGNKISFIDEPYSDHYIELVLINDIVTIQTSVLTNRGLVKFNLAVDENDEFKLFGSLGEFTEVKDIPSWGFKGREEFASSRGYIWSRSFPLLKDTIFLGYGPDTYALHFPYDDYLGKLQSNFSLDVLVDKPHNLYLQTAINTGVISLLSLITIFIMYLVSSIKLYFNKKEYNNLLESAGIAIFFSVLCYLMMGFLNDSVVSVSSVFWILLGIGFSINMKLSDEVKG